MSALHTALFKIRFGGLTPICELWTKNPQIGNMVERHLWTKNPHNFFFENSKSIFSPS